MAKKRLAIPGTTKHMIIEHDSEKNLIGVTDEMGKPAKKLKKGDMKIKFGEIEAAVIDVPEGTTFVTKHNPTCRWVYIGGRWYYICV